MLTLLSPPALWALAALVLPVALHLWKQPPRTVVLGSLRFLRTNVGPRWRDLRWREQALLWMRLALLALLVFLLARPVWRQPSSHAPQRWLLLDPAAALAGSTLARFQTLRTTGYRTHRLAAGLPEVARVAPDADAAAPDLWSLLAEADATLPAGSSLAVFSPARFASLQGLRPALRSRVEWVETPDAAGVTPRVWLERLRPAPSPGQPPGITVGTSEATRTTFADTPPLGWKLENHLGAARLVGPDGVLPPWTTVSAPPAPSVLILHDTDRAEEARVLAAALRAAGSVDGFPPRLETAVIGPDLLAHGTTDWTFWFSAQSPPPAVENRRTSLFEDVPGTGTESVGWIVPAPGTPGAGFLAPPIGLWRSNPPPVGPAVWTDRQGKALLTRTGSEHGPRWHFASHFDPTWTDLPRTTALPACLRALLWPAAPIDATRDRRLAAAEQARPAVATTQTPSGAPLSPVGMHATDLRWPLWLLAAVLFVTERLLSHRAARPARQSTLQTGAVLVR